MLYAYLVTIYQRGRQLWKSNRLWAMWVTKAFIPARTMPPKPQSKKNSLNRLRFSPTIACP